MGRLFNVLGETIDDKEKIPEDSEHWVIHRKAPSFEEQSPAVEVLETGIKVIDLLTPYAKEEDWSVRRCGCWKNRIDPGTDP